MAAEGTGSDTTETTGSGDAGASPPDWFRAYADGQRKLLEALDGRLGLVGKDLGRIREKLKVPSGENGGAMPPAMAATPPVAGPGGVAAATPEELRAAHRGGQLSAALPEGARGKISELLEEGRSFVEVERLVQFASAMSASAKSTQQQGEGEPRPPAPLGSAASAASRSPPQWPQDLAELRKLAESNPKAYQELMSLDQIGRAHV